MKFKLTKVNLSSRDVKRGLFLPERSSAELAEFIGILTGDGYMNYYKYQHKYLLEIAGDSRLDKIYLTNYVRKLIKKIFNIDSSFFQRKDQNTMYLRLISKGLIIYLTEIGFKKGRKEQINIPKWIISKRTYLLSFIKGLTDTDFSLYFRKNYPIIAFKSKSEVLVKSVHKFLKKEGFVISGCYIEKKVDKRGYENSITYSIKLNGHENLSLWLELINFRNKRHLDKLMRNGAAGI